MESTELQDQLFLQVLEKDLLPTVQKEFRDIVQTVRSLSDGILQGKGLRGGEVLEQLSRKVHEGLVASVPSNGIVSTEAVGIRLQILEHVRDVWKEVGERLLEIQNVVIGCRERIAALLHRIQKIKRNREQQRELLEAMKETGDTHRVQSRSVKAERNRQERMETQKKTIATIEADLKKSEDRLRGLEGKSVSTFPLSEEQDSTVGSVLQELYHHLDEVDPARVSIMDARLHYAEIYRRCIAEAKVQEHLERERMQKAQLQKMKTLFKDLISFDALRLEEAWDNAITRLEVKITDEEEVMFERDFHKVLVEEYAKLRIPDEECVKEKHAASERLSKFASQFDFDHLCDVLDELTAESREIIDECNKKMDAMKPENRKTKNMSIEEMDAVCRKVRETIKLCRKEKIMMFSIENLCKQVSRQHRFRALQRWWRNLWKKTS